MPSQKDSRANFGAGPSGCYRGGYVPRGPGSRRLSLFHLFIYKAYQDLDFVYKAFADLKETGIVQFVD